LHRDNQEKAAGLVSVLHFFGCFLFFVLRIDPRACLRGQHCPLTHILSPAELYLKKNLIFPSMSTLNMALSNPSPA
jgi:hypothetical protein